MADQPLRTEEAALARAVLDARRVAAIDEATREALHDPRPNLFTEVLDRSRKCVASRTLREPLPWQNSTLLPGDAADSVARLKKEPGGDLLVMGNGDLLQTLMRHGLVDRYLLMIHPLLLGRGRRLFHDYAPRAALRMEGSVTTTTGVVIATYEAA